MADRKATISFTIPHWFFVLTTIWLVAHWALSAIQALADLYLKMQ